MSSTATLSPSPSPRTAHTTFLGRWAGPIVGRFLKPRPDREALRLAFDTARVALGERMYAVGIDDGETSQLIARVEARLWSGGDEAISLRLERSKLIRRLADAALENDAPLPGADAEFDWAWAAKLACESKR